jgi:starch synthase
VPGVSTNVGGVGDVIDTFGLVAAYDDATGLARAVETLLGDPARRRAMGDRGRAAMVTRYGIDRLVTDIEALYRELLG